jgi:hypothetical protein
MYIFANKKDMIKHNQELLKEEHLSTNPVTRTQTQTTSKGTVCKGHEKYLKDKLTLTLC